MNDLLFYVVLAVFLIALVTNDSWPAFLGTLAALCIVAVGGYWALLPH